MIKKDGYALNQKGHYVPEEEIKEEELLKDSLINSLVEKSKELSEEIKLFKLQAMSDINEYMNILKEKYNVTKDTKGNLTLEDFAGLNKVQIAIAENIKFDEKLQIAKGVIDEVIEEETKDSNATVKILISKAFNVNKEGYVNPQVILQLRSLNIQNPKWQRAMDIIADSIKVIGKREYIRFYTRESQNKPYELVPLNIASV